MEKAKRKEMEFQIRRTEILNQAEKIFASKGFYIATMAEIADASGFAIGTLYHFFEGKENLYTTMVSEKLDMMYSEIRDAVNMADNAVATRSWPARESRARPPSARRSARTPGAARSPR